MLSTVNHIMSKVMYKAKRPRPIPAAKAENKRSVAKLRPKAPITASDSCNILEVAMKMAASRADLALLFTRHFTSIFVNTFVAPRIANNGQLFP